MGTQRGTHTLTCMGFRATDEYNMPVNMPPNFKSGIFSVGEQYKANAMYALFEVIDKAGQIRVVSVSDLTFIVHNDDVIVRAMFQITEAPSP